MKLRVSYLAKCDTIFPNIPDELMETNMWHLVMKWVEELDKNNVQGNAVIV